MIGQSSVAAASRNAIKLACYPNPFHNSVVVRAAKREPGAYISIVNEVGEEVMRSQFRDAEVTDCSFEWIPDGMASGVYHCLLRWNGGVEQVPMMLLK